MSDLSTPSQVGPYSVLEKLGSGGMGEVYLAEDPRLRRKVALKRLAPARLATAGATERFLLEARAAANLSHPNIAIVYDVLEYDEQPLIVMEYIEGETLAERLRRGVPRLRELLEIAMQIAGALVAAHGHLIVHRDLKPSNIAVTPSGQVKVLDFGLAKSLAPDESTLTQSGQLLGTPAYMSPEQRLGLPVDHRTDIYSLGVILFELATGRRPTPRPLREDAAGPGSSTDVRELRPDLPPQLSEIISRALAVEPTERQPSASDLLAELQQVQPAMHEATTLADDSSNTKPRPITPSGEAQPSALAPVLTVGRRPVILFAIAALLLIAWFAVQRTAAPSTPLRPTIAVLPIENLSPNQDDNYLAAGITDVLTTRMASIPGFLVLPRAVSLELGGSEARLIDHPGLTHYVEGSLQRSGNALRLSLLLASPTQEEVLWSDVFDGTTASFFALQKQAVDRLVHHLADDSLAGDALASLRDRLAEEPTLDLEAFSQFARARLLLDRYSIPGNLDQAIDALEQAVERDPAFALAHATLGEAYWRRFDSTREEQWIDRARDATLEALRLRPDEPGVRYALAVIYESTGRREQAIEELDRVIAQQPASDQAHRLLGRIYAKQGDADRSLEQFRLAMDLQPELPANYRELGLANYRLGRYTEAAAAFERLVELDPEDPSAYQRLGTAYHVLGDLERARANYERTLAITPSASTYSNLGAIHYTEGRFSLAAEAYRRSLDLSDTSPETWRNLAEAHEALQQNAEAVAAYERALDLLEGELRTNPDHAYMTALKAFCLAKLGRTAEALETSRTAVGLAPDYGEVAFLAATVNALAGEPLESVRLLRRARDAGYSDLNLLKSRDFDSLRGVPEFESLLGELRSAEGG